MKTASTKIAFAFVAALGATIALPLAAALADTSVKQTAPAATASTGIYDAGDMFRNAQGFPLTGWQGLIFPANS